MNGNEFTSLLGLLFEHLDAKEAVKEFFRDLGEVIDFMRRYNGLDCIPQHTLANLPNNVTQGMRKLRIVDRDKVLGGIPALISYWRLESKQFEDFAWEGDDKFALVLVAAMSKYAMVCEQYQSYYTEDDLLELEKLVRHRSARK
ncbi:MAG: hypothetical protein MHM6MM_004498 [Cercozoa sp. M6MM]